MPMYPYQAEDGSVLDRLLAPEDAEPIGTEFVHEGKVYKRVYIIQKTQETRNGSTAFPRVESKQLPRRVHGNKASDEVYRGFEKKGGTFNAQGQPRISSKEQATEIARAMSGDGATETTYGEL